MVGHVLGFKGNTSGIVLQYLKVDGFVTNRIEPLIGVKARVGFVLHEARDIFIAGDNAIILFQAFKVLTQRHKDTRDALNLVAVVS